MSCGEPSSGHLHSLSVTKTDLQWAWQALGSPGKQVKLLIPPETSWVSVEGGAGVDQHCLNIVLRSSSGLWVQRHPQVKSCADQIHVRNAALPFGDSQCVWAYSGLWDILEKVVFSTVFYPVFPQCLQCIWLQNTVSKGHILGNTQLSFFLVQNPQVFNIPSTYCLAPLQPPDFPH